MIRKVSNIMVKDFMVVDALTSIRHMQNIIREKEFESFPVTENNNFVGVVTYKDLVKAHPNRIIADAMTDQFAYIDQEASVWKAKDIFDTSHAELLLVLSQTKLVGIITKQVLHIELGKHIDLLTGLYKSDYIYYKGMCLDNSGKDVTVAFFDINNFGRIDKECGHIVGDVILQEIGTLLKNHLSEQSFLSRFGGDEFIILTSFNLNQTQAFIQKLLQIIAAHKFYNNIDVTVSVGIASKKGCNGESGTFLAISKLINCASLASTKAKKDKCGLAIVTGDKLHEAAG